MMLNKKAILSLPLLLSYNNGNVNASNSVHSSSSSSIWSLNSVTSTPCSTIPDPIHTNRRRRGTGTISSIVTRRSSIRPYSEYTNYNSRSSISSIRQRLQHVFGYSTSKRLDLHDSSIVIPASSTTTTTRTSSTSSTTSTNYDHFLNDEYEDGTGDDDAQDDEYKEPTMEQKINTNPRQERFYKRQRQEQTNINTKRKQLYQQFQQQKQQRLQDIESTIQQINSLLEQQFGQGVKVWNAFQPSQRSNASSSWSSKFVMLNVVMYGLQMIYPSITAWGAKRSDLILQGQELHRLVTPVFLHGSITHLLLNTFSLQNIGPEVERLFGSTRFVSTYLLSGIAGNIASAYTTPNPSLGASGCVFGLYFAYLTFLSRNEQFFGRQGQDIQGNVSGTMMMNVMFGFMSPSIDNWAHIGGGIGGAFMASTFGPKLFVINLPPGLGGGGGGGIGNGRSGGTIIIDKPSVQMPKSIQVLPQRWDEFWKRGKRRMQIDRYVSDLPLKPWRKSRYQRQRRRNRGSSGGGRFDGGGGGRRNPLKPMYGE